MARSPNIGETDITKVTVFDPENKLVAYTGTFKQGVREVISQWGNIYVLSTDGTVSYSLLTCGRDIKYHLCVAHESQRKVDV